MRLSWTRIVDSNVYNVYRGSVPSGGPFAYNHTCLATELPDDEMTDPVGPASSELQYYLISGTNVCGGGGTRGAS